VLGWKTRSTTTAPAETAPKLRGRRLAIGVTLPPDLVAEVDARAAKEDRSRAKMVEILLRSALAAARRSARV
jgi:hypothetical protein